MTNNVRALFTSDLDVIERNVVKDLEFKMGKQIGEVSEEYVIIVLELFYPYRELGGSRHRYQEFIIDLKRAYNDSRTGKVRTSNF